MTAGLFREEALRSFETPPWQPPLLSKPVSGFLLLAFVVTAAAAILGFAVSFEFVRKEEAHGHLTPALGWTQVAATSFGVVQRRLVEAGDQVEAGDVLFDLAPAEGLQRGLTVHAKLIQEVQEQRAVLESQDSLLQAQHENDLQRLEREHSLDEQELASLEQEIQLHRDRLRIAQRRLADGRRLAQGGALSAADVLGLLDDIRALAVPIAEKERACAVIRSSLAGKDERRNRLALGLQANRAAIREQLHDLAMQEHRIRGEGTARILAPRNGVVGSVRVRAGDRVTPGGTLLDILPQEAVLQARVYAPSAAMGHVDVGQAVRVYLDAFPYERYGAQAGRVVAISESTLAAGEANDGQTTAPSFQVDVEFPHGFNLQPPQQAALRPGMTVSVDFVGARGTLLDWALEPLAGATARL